MIDTEITVKGITLADQKLGDTGRRIISFFDVVAFGIELRGCKLIRTDRDGLTVTAPSLDDERSSRRGVAFKSDVTRSAILKAARQAYRALGGSDLPDWADKD